MEKYYLSKYFFSDWMMIGVTIVAAIIGIKYRNTDKQLRLITYYIMASLLTDGVCIYYEVLAPASKSNMKIESTFVAMFIFFEITIFFFYIYGTLSYMKLRMTMKIIFIAFILSVVCIAPNYSSFSYGSNSWLPALESLFLIVPCLFYFFELFSSQQITLKNHPSFWIVTGILFYNACSIPIFLLVDYMDKNPSAYYNVVFSLNYILYIILFLLFIKSYLCKKEVTF